MKYRKGDRVKCTLVAFDNVFGERNIWIIGGIKTQKKPYPSLYLCYRESDKRKMLFHFPESQVQKL